jgi:hypothetical protein
VKIEPRLEERESNKYTMQGIHENDAESLEKQLENLKSQLSLEILWVVILLCFSAPLIVERALQKLQHVNEQDIIQGSRRYCKMGIILLPCLLWCSTLLLTSQSTYLNTHYLKAISYEAPKPILPTGRPRNENSNERQTTDLRNTDVTNTDVTNIDVTTLLPQVGATVINFRSPKQQPSPDAVTLITQLDLSRLPIMQSLIKTWDGPASVAVFLTSHQQTLQVATLYDSDPTLQKHVALHLVYMSNETLADPRFVEYGVGAIYPINYLRTTALTHAQSDWVLHLDCDFVVMPQRHEQVQAMVHKEIATTIRDNRLLQKEKLVLVLPAFKMAPTERLDIPTNRQELIRLYHDPQSTLDKFSPFFHDGTDYTKWLEPKRTLSYVVPFTQAWEPYTISHRTSQPIYDVAFYGRHRNKVIHIWDLACHGFVFVVLPEVCMNTNERMNTRLSFDLGGGALTFLLLLSLHCRPL